MSRLLKLVSHIQDPYRFVHGWVSAGITTQTKGITGFLYWVGLLSLQGREPSVMATPRRDLAVMSRGITVR